ncbi:glutathione S-transferase C-terminal domain-containing protein [Plantactinospora endophytica]|uniref:Glutathione-dependent reductase n=1 Tax=Plantactinospora endophytica TaxID=673535 RepID=A0ABQ4E1B9_9ACTN|nr:glutathione S-transferase C-terminal domain-containing protein [Plantactinospora endophytica]GIG88452.1 glutathione-dependent reductase [Plantactinospora endophytica]
MPRLSRFSRLASPVDTATYGEYRVVTRADDPRPRYRFTGRVTEESWAGFTPRPGRYHLYAGWFCPWSQRVTITRALAGLDDVVSVSYVDNVRDGRGWAFREPHGPDPVNGFTLLREAYEATEEGFDGHVSVPVLWDRATAAVVSNDFRTIGIDLATRFHRHAVPVVETYPEEHRDEIEELDAWLGPAVNHGVHAAGRPGAAGAAARAALLDAFGRLDERLADRRYLLGPRLTEADVRLWVTLVRFDVGPNAGRAICPGLATYPHLWAYARDLYTLPAFRRTTDFGSFTVPGAAVPDWHAPADRPGRTAPGGPVQAR